MRGLTTDEQASEVLKVYLESKRIDAIDDDLLPFDAGAASVLQRVSEGRVGILLAQAHGLVQAGATAGIPVITADFAGKHFSGIGVEVESDTEDAIDGSDLDDLLLS